MLNTGAARVRTKEAYSVNKTAQCIDFVGGGKFEYELTGNAANPILVHSWSVWVPDEFIPALFYAVDSDATAQYMFEIITGDGCTNNSTASDDDEDNSLRRDLQFDSFDAEAMDISLDNFEEDNEPNSNRDGMEECLARFAALPANDNGFWIDGDTRHCRILHGAYAKSNPDHCPHISFEKEADLNGKYKCYESQGVTQEDVFTEFEPCRTSRRIPTLPLMSREIARVWILRLKQKTN